MNAIELAAVLLAAGCNSANYAINSRGSYSGCHVLHLTEGVWQVCFSERGRRDAPIFSSPDEAAACAYFYDFVMRIQHDHCVGFFRRQAAAITLENQLAAHDIPTRTDQIPYGGIRDPRFRVFVTGQDIFAAQQLLGKSLSMED